MENEPKSRSSQRLKYEAEVSVIKSKIGELEDVRQSLGLSQRKISQLLMVDPSAWTRWVSGKTQAPAHVFRALQWYLALIEKHPEWHPYNSFFKGFQDTNATDLRTSLQRQEKAFEQRLDEFKKENSSKMERKALLILTLFAGLCILQSIMLIFYFLRA